MRTTPNPSVKYHRDLYHDLDAADAAAARAARAESTCSECGSNFGMCGGWTREAVTSIGIDWLPHRLYGCSWDDHELFHPCFQCNPERNVPADFTPLTHVAVAEWLAQKCQCPD